MSLQGRESAHRVVSRPRVLASPGDFLDVPDDAPYHFRKSSGLFRDSLRDARPAFVVTDGNYVSARWPGDVDAFAERYSRTLVEFKSTESLL